MLFTMCGADTRALGNHTRFVQYVPTTPSMLTAACPYQPGEIGASCCATADPANGWATFNASWALTFGQADPTAMSPVEAWDFGFWPVGSEYNWNGTESAANAADLYVCCYQ